MSGKPAIEGDARRAALAIDALRRGWAITVEHLGQDLCLLPIETARDVAGTHAILLSASRAATLKLMNQRAAADTALPVMIKAPADVDINLALAVADPTLDLRYPMKGPFEALALADGPSAAAAIELARLAGLLPAFWSCPIRSVRLRPYPRRMSLRLTIAGRCILRRAHCCRLLRTLMLKSSHFERTWTRQIMSRC